MGKRVAACFIDWLLALIPHLFATVIGTIAALITISFWLLRDVNGGSPGKSLLGLAVFNAVGGPSTAKQRIIRNLPLALSLVALVVPGLEALTIPLQVGVFLIEAVLVLASGRRIGDRMADTVVRMKN